MPREGKQHRSGKAAVLEPDELQTLLLNRRPHRLAPRLPEVLSEALEQRNANASEA